MRKSGFNLGVGSRACSCLSYPLLPAAEKCLRFIFLLPTARMRRSWNSILGTPLAAPAPHQSVWTEMWWVMWCLRTSGTMLDCLVDRFTRVRATSRSKVHFSHDIRSPLGETVGLRMYVVLISVEGLVVLMALGTPENTSLRTVAPI